jgi:hypothetical protein
MKLSTWQCDRCKATEDFPDNEQPLGWFKCTDSDTARGPMCGGTWRPVTANDGEVK